MPEDLILEMKGITKSYPGVTVFEDFDFDPSQGRDPLHLWRERRREVDAHQDVLRGPRSGPWRDSTSTGRGSKA